jgi:hypothetical protein
LGLPHNPKILGEPDAEELIDHIPVQAHNLHCQYILLLILDQYQQPDSLSHLTNKLGCKKKIKQVTRKNDKRNNQK